MSPSDNTPNAANLVKLGTVCVAMVAIQAWFGLCLQDDAYISFRYARNAALGHGLVYNPGEPVEGYTNFLWTVLFVPVEWAGLDPGPVAALLGTLFTVALVHAAWRLGDRRALAPLLVAAFPGLALEGVQGLETCFYAWLVTWALIGGRLWPVLAGLAALTRPEGYAVFGLLWLLRGDKIKTGAAFLALTVPHIAFRWLTYHAWVPNTFHAKVGGAESLMGSAAVRGLRYLGDGAWSALPFAMLLVVAAGVAIKRRKLPVPKELAAFLGFFLVYIVSVGGDFKGTGRFLIPLLPALAVVAEGALWEVGGTRTSRLSVGVMVATIAWSIPGFLEMKHFADRFAEDLVRRRTLGLYLAETVPPHKVLAVHAAGILPYYAGLPTIDMWGLNDAHIARAPVENLGEGIAGHERHDYDYVLSRAPDFILPEQGLVTEMRVRLDDPPEFGPRFASFYQPASIEMEAGFFNLWVRKGTSTTSPPPDLSPPPSEEARQGQ